MTTAPIVEAIAVDPLRVPVSDPPIGISSVNRFAWTIEGVFTGPSGVAQVNRSLAAALEKAFPGRIRIIQVGPALENDAYAQADGLSALAARRPVGEKQILIYQNWGTHLQPPTGDADLRLAIPWWETTRLHPRDVAVFNRHFDALLAPSKFVADALSRSGVAIPVLVIGIGRDFEPFARLATQAADRPPAAPYTFLHISDCHPRKGVDVLIPAFTAAFRRRDNVRLVIKANDNPDARHHAAEVTRIMQQQPDAPEMEFIHQDLEPSQVLALYAAADCMVLPTRGEGLGLPAAEALVAGKHLIVTGFGACTEFAALGKIRFIDYRLKPATGYYQTDGAMWGDPDKVDLIAALREAPSLSRNENVDRAAILDTFAWDKWVTRIAGAVDAILASAQTRPRDTAQTLSLLTPLQALGYDKIRVGANGDGGYVMLDDLPPGLICYVLSANADKTSWDIAMAERGAVIFHCGETNAPPPISHPNMWIKTARLTGPPAAEQSTLTLETLISQAHHQPGVPMILKIDIEDGEWELIAATPSEMFAKFRQIIIEFHWLGRISNPVWHARFHDAFAKLRVTHVPVHVHANNWADLVTRDGHVFPDVLEVLFANRANYVFKPNTATFPSALDRPNSPERQDHHLGLFTFTGKANSSASAGVIRETA